MKQRIIASLFFTFLFSCKQESKNNQTELKSNEKELTQKESDSSLIIKDTLKVDPNLDNIKDVIVGKLTENDLVKYENRFQNSPLITLDFSNSHSNTSVVFQGQDYKDGLGVMKIN